MTAIGVSGFTTSDAGYVKAVAAVVFASTQTRMARRGSALDKLCSISVYVFVYPPDVSVRS